MKDWSLARVALVAVGYVAAFVLLSAAVAYWRLPVERGPDGGWKFFWLIPYSWVRNYALALLLPPCLLLVSWLVARARA